MSFWQEVGATLPRPVAGQQLPTPAGSSGEEGKLGGVVLAQVPAGSSPGSSQPATNA